MVMRRTGRGSVAVTLPVGRSNEGREEKIRRACEAEGARNE